MPKTTITREFWFGSGGYPYVPEGLPTVHEGDFTDDTIIVRGKTVFVRQGDPLVVTRTEEKTVHVYKTGYGYPDHTNYRIDLD